MTAGRRNNLDLVRLVAALAVVVSHAWPLALGPGAPEPLEGVAPVSLGGTAVLVFFFVSGLLVTASAHRPDRGLGAFALARAARILPGLLAALVATAGAFVAFSGPGYDLGTAVDYVAGGLSLVAVRHEIPGLFADNPYPLSPNGPLWTLFYEIACYAALAAAVGAGILRKPAGWIVTGAGVFLLWVTFLVTDAPEGGAAYRLATGAPLALAFAAGALSWRLRERLVLDWRVGGVLALAAALAGPAEMFLPLYITALGYTALLVAYRTPWIDLGGDVSYGVYIYGWPVAQMIVAAGGPVEPVALAIASTLAVLPIALLSWVLVERPALELSRRRAALVVA